jgi:hypothetical protein
VRKVLDGLLDILIVVVGVPALGGGLILEVFAAITGFLYLMALLGWRVDETGNPSFLLLMPFALAGVGYITFEYLPPRPQDTSPGRYRLAWLVIHIAGTVVFASAIVGTGIYLINVTHGIRLSEITHIHNEIPLRRSVASIAFTLVSLIIGAAASHAYTQWHRYTPDGWKVTHVKSQRHREHPAKERSVTSVLTPNIHRTRRVVLSSAISITRPASKSCLPAFVGACVAIGTFSGIAAGFNQNTSSFHIMLAALASTVAGALAGAEWLHRRSKDK